MEKRIGIYKKQKVRFMATRTVRSPSLVSCESRHKNVPRWEPHCCRRAFTDGNTSIKIWNGIWSLNLEIKFNFIDTNWPLEYYFFLTSLINWHDYFILVLKVLFNHYLCPLAWCQHCFTSCISTYMLFVQE